MDTKKKKLILAIFISFLMISSIAGFITLPANENNFEIKIYKGLEFSNINNKWVYLLNNNPIPLSFDPELLQEQDITSPSELNSAGKIYVSSDQEESNNLIYQELNILTQLLIPKTVNSCFEDSEKCSKLPLKKCEDAKDLNKVIIIKKENNKEIKYRDNCLEIKGSETEIIRFIDQLILSFLIE
ncbi:hypothetical protein J4449_02990 [Candidatus Woesearchaeota archaeon]|nr:hypothetical protein [Candidatus Woesearchaeota archaeon]